MSDPFGSLPDIKLSDSGFENELRDASGKTKPKVQISDSDIAKLGIKPPQNQIDTISNTTAQPQKSSAFEKACGCLTINYWSEFFQIDQTELTTRVKASINPLKNNLALLTEEKPDLYGPFWLAASCAFLLLISDSFWRVLTNMLSNQANRSVFNFSQIGFAGSLIFGAFGLFPLIFYISNRLLGSGASVVKCACIYGYSNVSFVAAALLSIIPVTGLRILFWIAAFLTSVVFLVSNLKNQIAKMQGNSKTCMLIFIAIFQLVITIAIIKNFYLTPLSTHPDTPAQKN